MNKLSIHGSRSLNDERVKIIILEEMEKYNIEEIVTHAEPDGVCMVARDLCKEKAIPLKLFFLNFKYLRGAFEHRSKDVLRDADRALFIHDGVSKGCSNELILAKKMGIPHNYYKLDQPEYKKSVGFDIDKDWDISSLDIKQLDLDNLFKENQ